MFASFLASLVAVGSCSPGKIYTCVKHHELEIEAALLRVTPARSMARLPGHTRCPRDKGPYACTNS